MVLGEFNHGKSTFINALLAEPVLPTGITPTTAVLTHVIEGAAGGDADLRIGRTALDRDRRARALAGRRGERQRERQPELAIARICTTSS